MTAKKRNSMLESLRKFKAKEKKERNILINKIAVVTILVVAIGGFVFANK